MKTSTDDIPTTALDILRQSIFTNTGGEVVSNKQGKRKILGSPTDTAILEFGLSIVGDFENERHLAKIVRVEPFNSTKKQMAVVVELSDGGVRAHCKGASEIVLANCDKVINENGEVVNLDDESLNILKSKIDEFAGKTSVETPIPSSGFTCIRIVGIKDPIRAVINENGEVVNLDDESLNILKSKIGEFAGETSVETPIPYSGFTCIEIVGIKDPVRAAVKESVALCLLHDDLVISSQYSRYNCILSCPTLSFRIKRHRLRVRLLRLPVTTGDYGLQNE
ncbi:hypothetical protein L2E82_11246 [Cichorium intybus]|uniref:Uncharacterized protein n=1 Tax=Cichorium intybus TaxID=13427 RepID=A0ACB9GCP3_CICIN|nr:hypothetical protein L2E82_11246 [Cichorium intybus]